MNKTDLNNQKIKNLPPSLAFINIYEQINYPL